MAEGFEGLHLPDPESWKLNPENASATLRSGRLILPVASQLTLPFFELGTEGTAFLIEFFGTIPLGSTVALQWEGEETPFLVVDPAGTVVAKAEEGQEEAEEFTPTGTNLRLTLTSGRVSLATADTPILFDFKPPAAPYPWLSVSLQSPPEGDDLEIDTILIVQEL